MFLVQGICSNAVGRPTVVEWMAVRGLPDHPQVEPMDAAFLRRCGVDPEMPGRARLHAADILQRLVPRAIEVARQHLAAQEGEYAARVEQVLKPYEERVQVWRQAALFGADAETVNRKAERRHALVASLRTSGAPMLRLLAVLEPVR